MANELIPQSGRARPTSGHAWFRYVGDPDNISVDEEHLLALAMQSAAPSRVCDATGRCRFLNRAWSAYTGRRAEQEVDDGWLLSVHEDERSDLMAQFFIGLRSRTGFESQYRLRTANGDYRWIHEQVSVWHDDRGAFGGLVSVCHEFGLFKLLSSKLEPSPQMSNTDTLAERERLAQEQLELATRMREQFMSIISHELRSPLNGIQSWAHVLESLVDTNHPLIKRALAGIRIGVEQQVKLIEDLLDSTNMLSGKVGVTLNPILLSEPLNVAVAQAGALATEKRVRLVVSGDTALSLQGDAGRLQQVFYGLLSNAVKASAEDGEVRIDTRRNDNGICVRVDDSGKGISAESLVHIFEPFRPADGSRARRSGGIGLGLAVARRIVELHHGRLVAESTGEGQGASFSVYLPAPE